MAIYENATVAAVQDNFKTLDRKNRLARFGGGVAHAVVAGVRETGRVLKVAVVAGVVGACTGFGLIMLGYPDPVVGLEHFASAPTCAIADEFGLANAKYGQPGYWKHHDTDRDGVACEK